MIIIFNKTLSLKYLFITCIIIIQCSYSKKIFALNISHNQQTQNHIQYIQLHTYNNSYINKIITINLSKYNTAYITLKQNLFKFKNKKHQIPQINCLYATSRTSLCKYNNIFSLCNNNLTKQYSHYILIKKKLKIINHPLINPLIKLLQHKKHTTFIINKSIKMILQSTNFATYIINKLKYQHETYDKISIIPLLKKLQIFTILKPKKINTIKNKTTTTTLTQINIKNQKLLLQFYIPTIYNNKSQYINLNTTIHTKQQTLSNQSHPLPKSIQNQIDFNYNLSIILDQQIHHIQEITLQHQKTITHITQVRKTFNKLLEQKKWLNNSLTLKEILRAQVAKLPNTPDFQKLNNNITQLQKKRLQYEYQIKKFPALLSKSTQDDGSPLTLSQQHILKRQITTQHNLIIKLLNNYDAQILELTKLKFSYEILQNELQNIQQSVHRYLFWVADVHPINTSYFLDVYQDIYKLFIEDQFKQQIISTLKTIYSNHNTLMLITFSIFTSIILYFSIYRRYQNFLKCSNKYIGKIHQDNFLITFYDIWYSITLALPIPILWGTIGYVLSNIWKYPIIIAIGKGINSTIFILWIFIISNYFASSKGLFIVHFGWSKKRIQQFFSRYYILSFSAIIVLIMSLIVFNNYNEQEFYSTLGRLCFILLCIYLTCITNNLKNSKLPLYINKDDSSNNTINYFLWNIMICVPIIASIACIFGYFFVAQELLMRLEISLFIWIALLIIYHLFRRWISIQRRRIAFEYVKQKISFRTHNKLNFIQYQNLTNNTLKSNQNNKKTSDLDIINIQSLQLIRSIITLIAVLLIALLWSELHFAFSFLENITLWDVTSTIKGVNNIQPITLNSFLIAVLVIIITTKTVHNLPAFLELTLLQRLNLNPGTGYAITNLTKYILMLLGGIIGCSLIGIEWSKIQWLIAALGVGLGFGLQEIFANFISGIIILFEKPIRIGDTITIRKLTGNVTRINTRATIITDWDHKEIIIPNKEFITKQFINWSLSDKITRVVLKVPGSTKINTKKMTSIFFQIIKNLPLALNTPPPEVYLSDLQYGFPIFEIRIYVADTKSRMPLRHQIHLLIVDYYQKNGIELPLCLLNYMYKNQLDNKPHN